MELVELWRNGRVVYAGDDVLRWMPQAAVDVRFYNVGEIRNRVVLCIRECGRL